MSNRLETSSASNLLSNKINIMLGGLNKDFSNFENKTKEDIITSFNEVVRKFYSTLEQPLFTYRELKEGKEPNIEELNSSFTAGQQDLEIVYEEMASIRKKLASNFNALSAMSARIKSNIAQASSDLLDYNIQNSNRIQPTFFDKFINLSKTESDQKSYNKDKAFVDTKNSRVVLPLDGEADVLKLKRLVIIDDSIGTSGNNQEIGAVARDNLQLLADGNMDTWFEFEQVNKNEITTPTILSVKLEFDEEKIFNLLEVAALAMPNGTYPAISAMRASVDDNVYFDLMPFYLGDFSKDSFGNSVIQLNPDETNPTDENMLYFFPKKIKYLTIKFLEDSSYFIRTPSGIRNRTAIGLKEVKAKAQKFKQEGQFLSSNYISDKELSKIAIITDEILPPNFDSTLDYFVSTDNGKNWDAIGPTQKVGTDKPEVLNYNIDFLEGSKKTEVPVRSVKLKVDLKVETSSDDTTINSSFKNQKKTEFLSINPGTKSIGVGEKPIGPVNIYQVNYGSVGAGSFYKIPTSEIKELTDKIIIQLPLEVFPSNTIKTDQEVLYIENSIWNRVGSLDGSSATDTDYEFDYVNNIITLYKLDSSNNREGKKPNGEILFKLERENPMFIKQGDTYSVNTVYKHDGIKEKIKIYKIKELDIVKEVRIKNLSTVHKLGISEIQSIAIVKDLNGKLLDSKPYVNGVLELADAGDYSVDKEKGILYTFSEISSNEEVIIGVTYKEKEDLKFDMKDGTITTKASDYKTENKTFSFDIVTPTYIIDLGIKNIAKGTIQFTEYPTAFGTEVSYDTVEASFNDLTITSPYAIDYVKGILYSRTPITGKIAGILAAADYFIEYNISRKIPQSAYSVIREDRNIIFNDDYILDYFAERQGSGMATPLFKIEYSFAEDIKESSGELIKYVTLFLNNYKIITTPKDAVT